MNDKRLDKDKPLRENKFKNTRGYGKRLLKKGRLTRSDVAILRRMGLIR